MKRKVFNFSLLAGIGLLAFGVVGLAGCSSSSTSFVAASVSLNKSSLQMAVGDVEKLSVTVSKGYGSDVKWFTSDEHTVKVRDGYVYAVGEGEATVTAAIGGGYAECQVKVSGEGGADPQSGKVLTINPASKTINLNETFTITAVGKNEDGSAITATFDSENPAIATVDANGTVKGVGVGSTKISVVGSNGLSKNCSVTVKDPSQGGSSTGRDIAVDTNLGYSGNLTVGSPLIQREFMTNLLREFNELTGSSVNFTVTTFEEDNGTSGYGSAESMPAVFPYASDQTLTLYQFNALSSVVRTDANWIKDQMGQDAYDAAKLSSVVGYPFSSDNGVVMFYNKSVCSAGDIDTLDKLFALADQKDMEVNMPIGNGFYAAGALMTFAEGKSLYKLTPTATSYTVTSNFNSDKGIEGAKVIRRIANEGSLRNATSAPINDVLATIVDASKVQDFKKTLGANYGVAPLPYVNATTRLGSFLGYKFYGVNNTLKDKTVASAVAKFLCSEYVQAKRYDEYNVRPTLKSLDDYAVGEEHIEALKAQQAAKATIPLTAISSELWSASATAEGAIKVLSATAANTEYASILDALDKACQPSK